MEPKKINKEIKTFIKKKDLNHQKKNHQIPLPLPPPLDLNQKKRTNQMIAVNQVI